MSDTVALSLVDGVYREVAVMRGEQTFPLTIRLDDLPR
jgi:hypothetical protein